MAQLQNCAVTNKSLMRTILTIISILFISSAFAQKTVKVEAEYTYIAPENISVEQAKLTALDRAKIQAIADEFGTLVSQSNTTYISNQNGDSKIDFQSLSGSDVKGEWIETIGEPEFAISYEQNMLVVKVMVKGRIREITSSQIDLKVQLLCNGTTSQFERSDFKSGDDMFLRFQSPVDGNLAVYLIDHTAESAYCLLPYSQSSDVVQKIEHDKQYVFFSPNDAPSEIRNKVDEYTMTCNGAIERNDIYVIFSPNEFVKANSIQHKESLPRELPIKEFIEWLTKIRKNDNKIQLLNKLLTIKN